MRKGSVCAHDIDFTRRIKFQLLELIATVRERERACTEVDMAAVETNKQFIQSCGAGEV
jgi:hypothetical protein